jgi:hypothetical protein
LWERAGKRDQSAGFDGREAAVSHEEDRLLHRKDIDLVMKNIVLD